MEMIYCAFRGDMENRYNDVEAAKVLNVSAPAHSNDDNNTWALLFSLLF